MTDLVSLKERLRALADAMPDGMTPEGALAAIEALERGQDEYLGALRKIAQHEAYCCVGLSPAQLAEVVIERGVYAENNAKAIEFAGYLATSATDFMDACNAYDEARERHEDAEPGEESAAAYDVMYAAEERRSDLWSGLRNAVYEFEWRRDRAALAAPTNPSPVNVE